MMVIAIMITSEKSSDFCEGVLHMINISKELIINNFYKFDTLINIVIIEESSGKMVE